MLCRLIRMLFSVRMMSVRDVRVVSGCFVFARFVMLCRFTMMTRGVFVVFRRFRMVFCAFMCCHFWTSLD